MKTLLPPSFFRSQARAAAFVLLLLLGMMVPRGNATILPAPTVTNSATPFNPSFDAANTVDQTQVEYASASLGIDTFIEYSFGSPQTFDKIVVINRDSGGNSDLIGNFTLTLNGGATTVSVTRTPTRGVSQVHSLGATRTATTVRVDVDTIGGPDTNNNTGAMEVFFVRTPVGQSAISASIFASAPAFAPDFSANNAVDGDIGRISAAGDAPEYASASLGANTFVDFDLGRVAPVGGFDYFDRPHVADRVTGFNLILSVNSTFGDGDDVLRSYDNSINTKMALGDVFAPISAQFIRFDVTSNLGGPAANTGISEMVFYQVPEPSAIALLALGVAVAAQRRRR
jgi:hypothetical protein